MTDDINIGYPLLITKDIKLKGDLIQKSLHLLLRTGHLPNRSRVVHPTLLTFRH